MTKKMMAGVVANTALLCLAILQAPASAGTLESLFDGKPEKPSEYLPQGVPIEEIAVEGNHFIPTEDILKLVKSRIGGISDRNQIWKDLGAIDSMGCFTSRMSNVRSSHGRSGLRLTYCVQENPTLRSVSFQGNTKLPSRRLFAFFAPQVGHPISLNGLSAAIDQLETEYHRHGFMLAQVVDMRGTDQRIQLTVHEGRIGKILIIGSRNFRRVINQDTAGVRRGRPYNDDAMKANLLALCRRYDLNDISRSLYTNARSGTSDEYDLTIRELPSQQSHGVDTLGVLF